jgi:hypothetical protein
MKDASLPLRRKYFELLNGNLTLNSVNVPVFSVVPNQAVFPFVVIDTSSELPSEDKDTFGVEYIQSIDIVTGYVNGGDGGYADCDLIAGQVKNIVKPSKTTNVFDLGVDFTNIVTIFERGNNVIEQTDTHFIVRRILEFKHIIQEN